MHLCMQVHHSVNYTIFECSAANQPKVARKFHSSVRTQCLISAHYAVNIHATYPQEGGSQEGQERTILSKPVAPARQTCTQTPSDQPSTSKPQSAELYVPDNRASVLWKSTQRAALISIHSEPYHCPAQMQYEDLRSPKDDHLFPHFYSLLSVVHRCTI